MAGRREFQPAHYGFNPRYAGRAPYTNNRQGAGQGSIAGRREFQPAHYGFNPGYAGRAPYTGHGGGRYGARTVVALSAAVVEVQALTSRGQHR
jgi:hypothetical protein